MEGAAFVPFSAHTRMSGLDWPVLVRKGSADAIGAWFAATGPRFRLRWRRTSAISGVRGNAARGRRKVSLGAST